ncbi:hypothetical protein H6G33_09880 [Calothrix sp. FACHB-1219]|uniref:hypothetical protein n=1 Tax=unclassified Calothrix TaxID=2619626 RepID=UPI001687A119|nr:MULTISPECIES: hypothetical protein [unclassified Calothrix]MBD2201655.1 hypothetical protein [Calothrix sp. FACHB-168]MBD2217341.1 hypothetical protein [Calothrix sp. FACHB-1219]
MLLKNGLGKVDSLKKVILPNQEEVSVPSTDKNNLHLLRKVLEQQKATLNNQLDTNDILTQIVDSWLSNKALASSTQVEEDSPAAKSSNGIDNSTSNDRTVSNENTVKKQKPNWVWGEQEYKGRIINIIEPVTFKDFQGLHKVNYKAKRMISPEGVAYFIPCVSTFCEKFNLVKEDPKSNSKKSKEKWVKDERPSHYNSWLNYYSYAVKHPKIKVIKCNWTMAPGLFPELEPYIETFKNLF